MKQHHEEEACYLNFRGRAPRNEGNKSPVLYTIPVYRDTTILYTIPVYRNTTILYTIPVYRDTTILYTIPVYRDTTILYTIPVYRDTTILYTIPVYRDTTTAKLLYDTIMSWNLRKQQAAPQWVCNQRSFITVIRTVAVLWLLTVRKPEHWGYTTKRRACGHVQNEPPIGYASVCLLAHRRTRNVWTQRSHSVGREVYMLARGRFLSSPNFAPSLQLFPPYNKPILQHAPLSLCVHQQVSPKVISTINDVF
jgi:hypothetical protein